MIPGGKKNIRRHRRTRLAAALACAVAGAMLSPGTSRAADSRLKNALGQLPLSFIENQGQTDARAAFYVRGKDKTLYFTSTGVVLVLSGAARKEDPAALARVGFAEPAQRWTLGLEFVGANPSVVPRGEDPTPAVISYFKGPPDRWKTGLKSYSRLVYADLWPGVDLIYSGSARRLKYQFLVRPGADPNRILLAYRGAQSVRVNERRELEVATPVGGFHDDRPQAYQEIDGERAAVPAAYSLKPGDGAGAVYGFQLGDYDAGKTLVIDPAILVYAGFIGGANDDRANGIAVDGDGNAYVTGETSSDATTFPVTTGAFDTIQNGGVDAFVAKVSADGTNLVYATYIGGSGTDRGNAIALKAGCVADCEAYITGETGSDATTFPVTAGAFDTIQNGGVDAFVARVSADGTSLVYATYIGGSGTDRGKGIAVDGAGAAYITGDTTSTQTTFPNGSGFGALVGPDLTQNGGVDAFVAKLNAAGTALTYAGFIGGSADDRGNAIALASGCVGSCEAYVAGETSSTNFPVTVGAFDTTQNGGVDAFVAKVNAAGTALTYAGLIGGSATDRANGIAVDGSGAAYVTGETNSTGATFPDGDGFGVLPGPDAIQNGGVDAFVAKVNAAGTALTYAGFIGGAADDRGNAIALAPSCVSICEAYVAGETASDQITFPVTVGPDLIQNGGVDAFVAQVKADGSALLLAGYIGGAGNDMGNAIAVDDSGAAYVAGETASNQLTFSPVVGPSLIQNGAVDAFVAKLCTAICLDLALTKSASAPGVQLGANITYTLTVTNHGPDGATGVTVVDTLPASVNFVSASPSAGSCSGTSTVTCHLGSLADGATATVTIVVTATTAGTAVNTATVSADQTDTDLTNNDASATVKVTLPNLSMDKLSVPSFVLPGASIEITDRTTNRSPVAAGASTTQIFLSSNPTLGAGDTLLGSRSIPPLAANGVSAGTTTVTIPLATALGKYFIIAEADALGAVDELNENDNANKNAAITITLPDLIVAKLSGFTSVAAGASINITDTTQNRGKVPAAASTTKFYLSIDAVFDGADVFLGFRPISPLGAGKKSSDSTVVAIPGGTIPGNYFIIAVADADFTVGETLEGNNARAKKIAVTP